MDNNILNNPKWKIDEPVENTIEEITGQAIVQKIPPRDPEHEIYNSLEDINAAVKEGKVISLMNLCELVHK